MAVRQSQQPTTVPPDLLYAEEALVAFFVYAQMVRHETSDKQSPALHLSGKTDRGCISEPQQRMIYFHFQSMQELMVKCYYHVAYRSRGDAMLKYHDRDNTFYYKPFDGDGTLILSMKEFVGAVETIKKARNCSYPQAVERVALVKIWGVNEHGQLFYHH